MSNSREEGSRNFLSCILQTWLSAYEVDRAQGHSCSILFGIHCKGLGCPPIGITEPIIIGAFRQ